MSLILTSNKTDFVTSFPSPLMLEGDHELALVNLETYNSIPNVIKDVTDSFTYSPDAGKTWIKIVVPTGSYELDEIVTYIYGKLKENNHWNDAENTSYILLDGNLNTLKCELNITDRRLQADFRERTSLAKILGFEAKIYSFGHHEAADTVSILSVNSVLVHCDLVSGSFVDGSAQPTLYSFFPNVSPGYKVVSAPHNLIYLPVTKNVVYSIRIWLTDQAGKAIDLRGETLTLRLHLKKC